MFFRSMISFLTVLLTAFLPSGCGAMTAQNPSGKYTPVNAVADGNDARVMLRGADVVAFFMDGKYLSGNPQFSRQ